MSLDLLLSRLDKPRRYGDGRWRARCPSCGGKNGTKLSIKDCGDGRILLHCFAGCDVAAVLGALGMDIGDVMPPQAEDHKPRMRRPWTVREVTEAFQHELGIAVMILYDLSKDRQISRTDRARAGRCAELCAAMMQELSA